MDRPRSRRRRILPERGRFRPSRCGGPVDESGPGGARPGAFHGDGGAQRLGVLDQVIVGRPDQPTSVIAATGGVVDQPGGALPTQGGWALGPAGAEAASGSMEVGSLWCMSVGFFRPCRDGHDNRTPRADPVRPGSPSTGSACSRRSQPECGRRPRTMAHGRCSESKCPPADKIGLRGGVRFLGGRADALRLAGCVQRPVVSRCWSWLPRRLGPRFLRG